MNIVFKMAFFYQLIKALHLVCLSCQGKICDPNVTCNNCVSWGEDQWSLYRSVHAELEARRLKTKNVGLLKGFLGHAPAASSDEISDFSSFTDW